MARKANLREQREGTVINLTSKTQETELGKALRAVERKLRKEFDQLHFHHARELGKNVIGFRAAMLAEEIMPFVCFGYGCDVEAGSSIRDRVVTIAMFGPLNRISVMNEGEAKRFNRGSFFFREKAWSERKMAEVMHEVARRSIDYYFAKLGRDAFQSSA